MSDAPGVVAFPLERGGWWHEYVCGLHGTELVHDGMVDGVFPSEGARCSYGCRWDTPTVRGAWAVLAHQACAVRIGELADSHDPADRDRAVRLLRDYAAFHANLPVEHDGSQAWMTSGRLFHQALTEAIWAVRIASAVWTLRDRGVDLGPEVADLLETLVDGARTARESLLSQGKERSNYIAWLDAAGAVCSRDPEWLTGPDGMFEHVLTTTLPDGWHWEATTYYHSFVLRAALVAIAAMPETEIPESVRERLAAMRRVLVELMAPAGDLPALSDGPYRRDGYTAELAELDLAPDLEQAPIVVHPDGGRVIVRHAGIHAVLNFGPHGESHGHFDTASLLLYGAVPGEQAAWQPDPGEVPYAHRVWRQHYASTAAHPTVSIDGLDQQPCVGTLGDVTADSVTITCDTAWPDVRLTRTLRLVPDGLVDEVTVQCEWTRRIALQLRPALDFTLAPADGGFRTAWRGGSTLVGIHHSSAPSETLARPGPGPADDPQRVVTHLDWVAVTDSVIFTSRYCAESGRD